MDIDNRIEEIVSNWKINFIISNRETKYVNEYIKNNCKDGDYYNFFIELCNYYGIQEFISDFFVDLRKNPSFKFCNNAIKAEALKLGMIKKREKTSSKNKKINVET